MFLGLWVLLFASFNPIHRYYVQVKFFGFVVSAQASFFEDNMSAPEMQNEIMVRLSRIIHEEKK